MNEIMAEEETDGILLIDAPNASNFLNRASVLHDIQYLCPPLFKYKRNYYGIPAQLLVATGHEFESADSKTQGDPTAQARLLLKENCHIYLKSSSNYY